MQSGGITYKPGDCVYIEPDDEFEFDTEAQMKRKKLKTEKEKDNDNKTKNIEDEGGYWIARILSIWKVIKLRESKEYLDI